MVITASAIIIVAASAIIAAVAITAITVTTAAAIIIAATKIFRDRVCVCVCVYVCVCVCGRRRRRPRSSREFSEKILGAGVGGRGVCVPPVFLRTPNRTAATVRVSKFFFPASLGECRG